MMSDAPLMGTVFPSLLSFACIQKPQMLLTLCSHPPFFDFITSNIFFIRTEHPVSQAPRAPAHFMILLPVLYNTVIPF